MKVYFEAVSEYQTADVLDAVHAFITGSVPGHNPSFAPSAPEVGSACRRAMFKRLDAERLDKLALPPPPDTWVDDAPDVKARNKAKLDQLAADLAAALRTDEAETERRRLETMNRTNARFAPDYDPKAMARRLGFDVGDPDEQNGDMGTRGAA